MNKKNEAVWGTRFKQKIISNKTSKKIIIGLKKIHKEIINNKFKFQKKHEDIHLNIEKRLFEIIGDEAGYMHIARSRNDQVITDFKMWIRSATKEINKNLENIIKTILKEVPVKAATPSGFSERFSKFFKNLFLSLVNISTYAIR